MSSGNKFKLVYDATTPADGDALAAFLHATNALTSQTVGAQEALDVYQQGVFAEDAAHTTGDLGQFVVAVRNDVEGSMVDTDGDYAPLQVDALGRLRVVADLNVNNDFVYAEDSAAVSGNLGGSVLLVRQDTLAASTSTDGDYGQFKSNAAGELYVFDTTTHTQLAALSKLEDSAHTTGDTGIMSLAVANEALVNLSSADGDYTPFAVDRKGRIFTSTSLASPTALTNGQAQVTTTSGLLIAAATDRREIIIQNNGTKEIAFGASGVTYNATGVNATDGILIRPGGEQVVTVGAAVAIHAVAQSGTQNVRWMQLAG